MYQTQGSYLETSTEKNRTLSEESHPSKRDTVTCNAAGLFKEKGEKKHGGNRTYSRRSEPPRHYF